MKKFGRILTILLVAAVFIGTFAYLFQRSRPKEIQYEELTPEMGTISKSTVVTGKIQPRDEVNVKAQISGIVAELYKEAGQTVEKNEVIAKLKVIPEMSQLSSAQSRVRLSEVNLKQAQTNYDRQKNLFDQQLVSAEAFEQVAQALKQAQEEYAASVESLEIIRDGVSSSNKSGSSTLVRSSVAGLILDIPVKVGNTVINSNTFNDGTTIATVADMNDLILSACPSASPWAPCRTSPSTRPWSTSPRRPRNPAARTSSRSRPPSRSRTASPSVPATAPTPRSSSSGKRT